MSRRKPSKPDQSPELPTLASTQLSGAGPLGENDPNGDDLTLATFTRKDVRKENKLALARYDLSPRAQMLVFYAITLIQPDDQNLSRIYKIEARELANWAELHLPSLRRDMWDQKTAAQTPIGIELLQSWMIIPDHFHAERGIVTDLGCQWFSTVIPSSPTGPCDYLDVRFNPDLIPYLVGLRERYYQARRVFIVKLDSRYALRLYEWIESERYRLTSRSGRLVVDLDDLRGILGTDEPTRNPGSGKKEKDNNSREQFTRNGKHYERKLGSYHHFRDRALEVAVTELNTHTDLQVGYAALRGGAKGRGVHTIEFTITPKGAGVTSAPTGTAPEPGGLKQMMLDYAPAAGGHGGRSPADQPAVTASQTPAEGAPEPGRTVAPAGDLERLLDDLEAKYRLSRKQRESIPGTARGHGYVTDGQIIDWLLALDKGVIGKGSDNASRDFCAAVKNNYAPGVPAWKLNPTRHPAKTGLAAKSVPPSEREVEMPPSPTDPDIAPGDFEAMKLKIKESMEEAERRHAEAQAEHRANRHLGRNRKSS